MRFPTTTTTPESPAANWHMQSLDPKKATLIIGCSDQTFDSSKVLDYPPGTTLEVKNPGAVVDTYGRAYPSAVATATALAADSLNQIVIIGHSACDTFTKSNGARPEQPEVQSWLNIYLNPQDIQQKDASDSDTRIKTHIRAQVTKMKNLLQKLRLEQKISVAGKFIDQDFRVETVA